MISQHSHQPTRGNSGSTHLRLRRPLLIAQLLLGVLWPSALSAQGNYPTPYEFSTIAGFAKSKGYINASGTFARFDEPRGIALGSDGNIYIADSNNNTIRKVTAAGVVSTFAGTKQTTYSDLVDGVGANARFDSPRGMAVDASGTLYVADYQNHAIRKITTDGSVTTLAGDYRNFGSRDGTGTAARFFYPYAVAVDSFGNVYVADEGNDLIRKITPDGVVTTLAGSAKEGGSADGFGSAARFNSPEGIAVDSQDNILVADTWNHLIRKITPDGMVSTLAGKAEAQGRLDGIGDAARFNKPTGITVDADDNLFVTDAFGQTIRKVSSNGTVSTLAGKYADGDASDGIGKEAGFFNPTGIAVDANGTLFVVESVNHTLRSGVPAIVNSPPLADAQSASVNEDRTLAIQLTGSDPESSPLTFTIDSPPLHGTLGGSPPALIYRPAANFNGSDSFRFRVHDGVNTSSPAVVALTVSAVNDVPISRNLAVRTRKNKAVKITLSASDIEKSQLKYRIVKFPTKGTLTGKPPRLTYTPRSKSVGTDSFTFKASDGTMNSKAGTIRITITP